MSALDTVARPFRGRSHVGGELRRRRVSVIGETAARASKRHGDKGETVEEVTAISKEDSAGSGRQRRRRIAGEVAGGRRLGMSSGKTLQGSRGRMGWCRRRRRRWRFLWTHRGGTGWTVAAVICVGDDELRSGVLERGSRGEGESRE